MLLKSRRALACLCVLTSLGVAGCGSGSSGGSSSSSSTSSSGTTTSTKATASPVSQALAPYLKPPTTLQVDAMLPKRPPAGKTIVFLSNGIGIAQQIGAGIEGAAHALGWTYKTLSVNQNNPATVASSMAEAVNSGASAVVVSATSSAIYGSVLPIAKAHGTAVIDVSSGNPPTGETAIVNSSHASGPLWGKILALGALANAQASKTKANLLLITSPVFTTILGPTDVAAQATVKAQCPSCTYHVLDISAQDVFSGKGPSDVVSYVQSHPGVNDILEDSSLVDEGLVPALKGASLSNIKIFGVAPLQAQIQEVQAGQEQGWVVTGLQVDGWMAADAAARAVVGDDPAIYNDKQGPAYLLTSSNKNGPLEIPTNYVQLFKNMWKVS